MSTPCGVHDPISPASFAARVDQWHTRVGHVEYRHEDYADILKEVEKDDLVYCDPPYSDSQTILYGAQRFRLEELFDVIANCKERDASVALSIDGTKKSGTRYCNIPIPKGLFIREITIDCGRSMLRRFQREGQELHDEVVKDRLLLTY